MKPVDDSSAIFLMVVAISFTCKLRPSMISERSAMRVVAYSSVDGCSESMGTADN